jgi:hypothetical protein
MARVTWGELALLAACPAKEPTDTELKLSHGWDGGGDTPPGLSVPDLQRPSWLVVCE